MKIKFNSYDNIPTEGLTLVAPGMDEQQISLKEIQSGEPIKITKVPDNLYDLKFKESDSAHIYVDPVLAIANITEKNNKLIADTTKALKDQIFKDDHGTTYNFSQDCTELTMTTVRAFNGTKTFMYKFELFAGYCILKPFADSKYPRKDALTYKYSTAGDGGYTLEMIPPSIPSSFAPKVIKLTKGEEVNPSMKKRLENAEFIDTDNSTYKFSEDAGTCEMKYSGGTVEFTMGYNEDKDQCTMQAAGYAESQTLTYTYKGDPLKKITLTLVTPKASEMVPKTIKLTRTNA